ncbi:hypothetical protein GCM10010191_66050 [Actinomadura vinacea]|uniref:Uncharacterized protein n=1 Tax=Actinomadura vinacea TaxID=115336 RepID=A0ABN3JXX9_9ACTN
MVCKSCTGRDIAYALHDELLRPRAEQRATLRVRHAYQRYTKWGWHKTAQPRPGWPGAPLLDVLMLDLATR